ncbi:MAG TPA: pyridoxamine 5'-phosphate oxidase family protein, partial [Acidimicrobiia bacterium]|nr:pyridoxamine 5'-phosphate oxidase family protein [Acidimicrobiia bacterium]
MLEKRPELTAQLDEDLVGWLTTVTPDGQPQSSVVWFLRDADDLLVYSRPDATKLTNIATNAKVAFNLRGDDVADAVATFEATAMIVDSPTPP